MAGSYSSLAQHLDALDSAIIGDGVNTYAASHVLQLVDGGSVVEMTSGSAITLTIPANAAVAHPIGTVVSVVAGGAGVVTVAAANGVTLRSAGSLVTLSAQWAGASLYQRAADEWVLMGSLA